ncbi:MAG TPA: hypothetical protein VLT36_20705 [Candidatus Dormibacteraeota bacterium]|nr:hypothetical protein [Candidatus Dormibacteraeota bacterium]
MHGSITRVLASAGVFFMSMLLLLFLCIPAWDAMEQPDAIKTGWSIAGRWCLWCAFIGSSVLVSAFFAIGLWRAGSPNKRPAVDAGSPLGLDSERHFPRYH